MATKNPFNPYPITGEDMFNQPSSRNIAPITQMQQGGIPETMPGYSKRHLVNKKNTYAIQAMAVNQIILSSAVDLDGATGIINLGNVIGLKQPWIFVPHLYSIALNAGTANLLALVSMIVYLKDLQTGARLLYASSPTIPATTFTKLGFEIAIPPIQYDDFIDYARYTQYLNNIGIEYDLVIDSASGNVIDIEIDQALIYTLEDII